MIKVRRLYIIGAGASCPYGLPTLKNLLWELCQFLDQQKRNILKTAIYEACGVNLECPENSPDFEEFLNRLDAQSLLYLHEDQLNRLSSLRSKAATIALKGLRNFFLQKSRALGTKVGPYDRLVASLDDKDAIVSFNWDILLEVAFRRQNRKYSYISTESSKDSTLLLKPHGSINWYALLDRELLKIDLTANVAVFGDDLTNYMLYLRNPLGRLDMGSSNIFAKRATSPLSAIVLPTPTMALSVGGSTHDNWVDEGHIRAMRAVWKAFKDMVENANDLVVIGYSLPGTDSAAIDVLKEFRKRGARRLLSKRIVIIDKNRRIVERYQRIVYPNAKLISEDFNRFHPGML
jgi:hypothetical protein